MIFSKISCSKAWKHHVKNAHSRASISANYNRINLKLSGDVSKMVLFLKIEFWKKKIFENFLKFFFIRAILQFHSKSSNRGSVNSIVLLSGLDTLSTVEYFYRLRAGCAGGAAGRRHQARPLQVSIHRRSNETTAEHRKRAWVDTSRSIEHEAKCKSPILS